MFDQLDPQDYRDSEPFIVYRSDAEMCVARGAKRIADIKRMQGKEFRADWIRDALETSKVVAMIPGYFDTYVWRSAKIGLPKPDAFQVSPATPKIVANLGL